MLPAGNRFYVEHLKNVEMKHLSIIGAPIIRYLTDTGRVRNNEEPGQNETD